MSIKWNVSDYSYLGSEKLSTELHIITYANGRHRQFYLGISRSAAMSKFELQMAERNPVEIRHEGWDAALETIGFNEAGEAWIGSLDGPEFDFDNILDVLQLHRRKSSRPPK